MKNSIISICICLCISLGGKAQRLDLIINTAWQFHKGDTSAVDHTWETVNLPHTWNDKDAFDEEKGYYRGIGWYSKELNIPKAWRGKSINIQFEGANQETDVFINGKYLGNHKGGYTAFNFDISGHVNYGEKNFLTVKVNNQYDKNIPPLNADFTFYGGIYRNVHLIVAEAVHFDIDDFASDGVFIETPSVSKEKALIQISGKVINGTTENRKLSIITSLLDSNRKEVANKISAISISAGSSYSFLQEKLELNNPKLWSPDSPYLYHAVIQIKEEGSDLVYDEITLPVGLRWYSFSGNGFMLNGKSLKLIGTNRHQDFKGKGNALSDDYHRYDYTKIKSLGFNFVRLAHYPQARAVYRTCDELGLLVWSEIPVVNEITQTKEFTDNCLTMQMEHIRQTRNHPSVILYGYMNEIYIRMLSDRSASEEKRNQIADATIELAKKLNALTKKEAPAVNTVMAQDWNQAYNTYGISAIPDVLGWNLYFGWYYGELEDLSKFLIEEHRKYPHRPVIVSEFGADADIRIHSLKPRPWDFSQDYQNILHASYLKQMLSLKFLSGFAAWNFADFGAEGRANSIPFINQKGLVNYDRTDKVVTDLYRAYFTKQPVLRIASHNNLIRMGVESSGNSNQSIQPVTIFSNSKEVTLKLNGKLVGKQPVKFHQVSFAVPFTQGINQLESYDEKGNTDRVNINFRVIPTRLNTENIKDLAVSAGAFEYFLEKPVNVLWIPDQPYAKGSWGYIGGAPYTTFDRVLKVGVGNNILGTNNNPVFQTFDEGIEGYRFDVGDGNYEVTLCFAEYNSKMATDDNIYDFSTEKTKSNVEKRVFSLDINGKKILDSLNLAKAYEPLRAVTFVVNTTARHNSGIEVKFIAISGKTLLNGIRIKKLD